MKNLLSSLSQVKCMLLISYIAWQLLEIFYSSLSADSYFKMNA